MLAHKIPAKMVESISKVKWLCANSCPPLNPIEKSKYKDINFEEFGGISRSLFNFTAMIPSKKNKKAGFVKFENNKSKFILCVEWWFKNQIGNYAI